MNKVYIMHEMKLVRQDPNGEYEWTCDECGRTVIFGNHKMKIVVKGNNNPDVLHSGSSGNLNIGYTEVKQERI